MLCAGALCPTSSGSRGTVDNLPGLKDGACRAFGQRGEHRCSLCIPSPLIDGVELQFAPHTPVGPAGHHGAVVVARDDRLVGSGAAKATGI